MKNQKKQTFQHHAPKWDNVEGVNVVILEEDVQKRNEVNMCANNDKPGREIHEYSLRREFYTDKHIEDRYI